MNIIKNIFATYKKQKIKLKVKKLPETVQNILTDKINLIDELIVKGTPKVYFIGEQHSSKEHAILSSQIIKIIKPKKVLNEAATNICLPEKSTLNLEDLISNEQINPETKRLILAKTINEYETPLQLLSEKNQIRLVEVVRNVLLDEIRLATASPKTQNDEIREAINYFSLQNEKIPSYKDVNTHNKIIELDLKKDESQIGKIYSLYSNLVKKLTYNLKTKKEKTTYRIFLYDNLITDTINHVQATEFPFDNQKIKIQRLKLQEKITKTIQNKSKIDFKQTIKYYQEKEVQNYLRELTMSRILNYQCSKEKFPMVALVGKSHLNKKSPLRINLKNNYCIITLK